MHVVGIDMKELKGKVAVITGAGRGIGRGIALHCAHNSIKIVLAGIGMESLTRTAADLNSLGAETLIVQTDVSLQEDVERLAERSFATFGAVDLLVNNAGAQVSGASVYDSTMDDWNWVMGVNFFGVLFAIRAFVPRIIEHNTQAHIVNVASLFGIVEATGSYDVSKHAAVALTESLYHDLAENAPQIKVSVYCPGAVNTEMYRIGDSRSERYMGNATEHSAEARSGYKDFINNYGFSVEEAVHVLFEGIEQDKLYIGPLAYQKQLPKILDVIRERADNIADERNPEHPRNIGAVISTDERDKLP